MWFAKPPLQPVGCLPRDHSSPDVRSSAFTSAFKAGLDPAIHQENNSSCETMDTRLKPAYDAQPDRYTLS
jgi:hypothetical protein